MQTKLLNNVGTIYWETNLLHPCFLPKVRRDGTNLVHRGCAPGLPVRTQVCPAPQPLKHGECSTVRALANVPHSQRTPSLKAETWTRGRPVGFVEGTFFLTRTIRMVLASADRLVARLLALLLGQSVGSFAFCSQLQTIVSLFLRFRFTRLLAGTLFGPPNSDRLHHNSWSRFEN